MKANCPRCGKSCPVGYHQSAHCSRCFTSFRADSPGSCLTREERQAIGNRSGPDSAVSVPFDTGMVHGPDTLDTVWERHFARCADRPAQQGNDVTNVWD